MMHEPEKLTFALTRGFVYLREKGTILILGLMTILSDVAIWGALSVLTIEQVLSLEKIPSKN